jgi:hypothetical protein
LSSRDPCWGIRRAAVRGVFTATSLHCGLNAGSSLVLDAGRRRTPVCADALIGVIETRLGSGATLPTARQPWSSASGAPEPRVSKEPRMHPLDPGPKPPAGEPAARGRRRARRARRGRQGSPTRCNCGVVRPAAALRSSRPRRSLSCWPGLPATRPRRLPRPGPPPPPASPWGQKPATPAGRRPAQPSPAGAADASMQPRTGGREGAPTPREVRSFRRHPVWVSWQRGGGTASPGRWGTGL